MFFNLNGKALTYVLSAVAVVSIAFTMPTLLAAATKYQVVETHLNTGKTATHGPAVDSEQNCVDYAKIVASKPLQSKVGAITNSERKVSCEEVSE